MFIGLTLEGISGDDIGNSDTDFGGIDCTFSCDSDGDL